MWKDSHNNKQINNLKLLLSEDTPNKTCIHTHVSCVLKLISTLLNIILILILNRAYKLLAFK